MANIPGLEAYIGKLDETKLRSEMSPEQQAQMLQLLENANKVSDMKQKASPQVKYDGTRPSQVVHASSDLNDVEEYKRLMKQLQDQSDASLNDQSRGIAEQEQKIKDLENSGNAFSQWNLSPLLAWYDAQNKTNMAASYKAPQSSVEKQKMLIDLSQGLQKSRGEMSKQDIDNTKALLNASLVNKQIGAADKASRQAVAQDLKMFDQASKEQAKLVGGYADFGQKAGNVEAAFTPAADGTVSLGRVKSAITQFSKLMGESAVVSDADAARQFQPTLDAMLGDFEAKWGSNPNTRIPKQNIQHMLDAVTEAKRQFQIAYKQKADAFTEGKFKNPGSPYAGKAWAPKIVEDTYAPLKSFGPPSASAAGLPSQDAIAAELARRSKK